jgi:peroxiredoxin
MSSNDSVQQGAVPDFDRMGPRVGERFPDVALPDQHGQPVDLHKTRAGRKGLVVFYRSAGW